MPFWLKLAQCRLEFPTHPPFNIRIGATPARRPLEAVVFALLRLFAHSDNSLIDGVLADPANQRQ